MSSLGAWKKNLDLRRNGRSQNIRANGTEGWETCSLTFSITSETMATCIPLVGNHIFQPVNEIDKDGREGGSTAYIACGVSDSRLLC